jgi:hypothetical protein
MLVSDDVFLRILLHDLHPVEFVRSGLETGDVPSAMIGFGCGKPGR